MDGEVIGHIRSNKTKKRDIDCSRSNNLKRVEAKRPLLPLLDPTWQACCGQQARICEDTGQNG